MSVFFGAPDAAGAHMAYCSDVIVPVCAPALKDRAKSLEQLPLLHDQTWLDDWKLWATSANQTIQNPQKGAQFSLYSLAVEEAKAGAGVLMGHLCLIEDALATGALVKYHDHSCDTGRYLVVSIPHVSRQRPETKEVVSIVMAT